MKETGDHSTRGAAEQHGLRAQLTDIAAETRELMMGQKVDFRALISSARSCFQLVPPFAIQFLLQVVSPCQPRALFLCDPAGIVSSCEIAETCSLARELPVCFQVLEQHHIDYCLIFAGLQNVQGDTGKFRDF